MCVYELMCFWLACTYLLQHILSLFRNESKISISFRSLDSFLKFCQVQVNYDRKVIKDFVQTSTIYYYILDLQSECIVFLSLFAQFHIILLHRLFSIEELYV